MSGARGTAPAGGAGPRFANVNLNAATKAPAVLRSSALGTTHDKKREKNIIIYTQV
jgi:hypothetical protein